MEISIPDVWKSTVSRVLRQGSKETVLIRRRARQDWGEMFPGAFEYELRDALVVALGRPDLRGRQVFGLLEPGETYEFIFQHEGRAVYTKLCLQKPEVVVIVYSAHRPLRGERL